MIALIVDDERRARVTIKGIIKLYTPEIETILEADSVDTAVFAIRKHQPNLVFLDIHLGNDSGFDVFDLVKNDNLNVIFITAYDDYALKAIRVSAIDYLMKPINPNLFVKAVDKALTKIENQQLLERVGLLMNQLKQPNDPIRKMTLKTANSIHIISVDDIIYCEGQKNYTAFYLLDDRKIIISKNLSEYEALLPNDLFIRTHQSYLVNVNHILQYDTGSKNELICTNNHIAIVSVRKKEHVLKILKKLNKSS